MGEEGEINTHMPLRALAPISAVALVCAPSAAAQPTSYPPVYHLLAQVTGMEGTASATATFTGTLVVRGSEGTLRWKLVLSGSPGAAVSVVLRTKPSATTQASAVRLCPPPACVQGTYRGSIGRGSAFLAGLLHKRAVADVRTASPAGELHGLVMVAVAAGA